jgi:hypothetical protein
MISPRRHRLDPHKRYSYLLRDAALAGVPSSHFPLLHLCTASLAHALACLLGGRRPAAATLTVHRALATAIVQPGLKG